MEQINYQQIYTFKYDDAIEFTNHRKIMIEDGFYCIEKNELENGKIISRYLQQ